MMPESSDCLSSYLAQIGRYPRLALEDEPSASREELITSNLRLAVHIAKTYARNTDHLLDLVQDANEGLIKAADAYDHTRGRFSVCAALWIRSYIRSRLSNGIGSRQQKEKIEVTSIDYHEDLESGDDPATQAVEQKYLEQAYSVLTPFRRYVIEQRLAGLTHREIAHNRGTSHQRVQQLQNEAIKAIHKAGE